MKEFKKKLKSMSSIELRELMNKANLSDYEYWLVRYAFIENRLVANTCMKLNIGRTKYFTDLGLALLKLYYTSQSLK